MTEPQQHPELIRSDDVIHKRDVDNVEVLEKWRVGAAVVFTGIGLFVGIFMLIWSADRGNSELQTWATGLISAIIGASIGYGFSVKRGG